MTKSELYREYLEACRTDNTEKARAIFEEILGLTRPTNMTKTTMKMKAVV